MIAESIVLLVQELSSSIAFRIANRLKLGRGRWQRASLEFAVFALLVVPLFFALGWLLLQAISWFFLQ